MVGITIQEHQSLEPVIAVNKKLCHSCSNRITVSDEIQFTFKSGVSVSFCNESEKQSFLSKHKLN